ncbi:MAG: T9SS type A sorting domain-containing protein [Bacteroidota bacterium]
MKKFILIIYILFPIFLYSQTNWEGFGIGVSGNGVKCYFEDTLNDQLIVGGEFSAIDTFLNNGLAVWDSEKWDCFSDGLLINFQIFSIIKYIDTLYVAGYFPYGIGTNDTIRNLAKWDGTNWKHVVDFNNYGYIRNMRVINNELYILGTFDSINDVVANGLAKYNGVEWSNVYNLPQFYSTSANFINDIAYYENELYVGGNFVNDDQTIRDIVKYNGSEWADVGGSLKGGSANINRMLVFDNELVVAGTFYKSDGNVGNHIMTWNGTEWQELGDFVETNSSIKDMRIHNDELYIGGTFSIVSDIAIQCIAIWDGQKICGLGGDFDLNVYSLGFYRDTLFVGCGNYVDSIQVNRLVRWVGGNYIDTCSTLQSVQNIVGQNDKIFVYPNPVNNEINILLPDFENEIIQVTLININGSKIFENEFKVNNNHIIINDLKAEKGIYFLRMSTNEMVEVKKLIISQ